MTSVVVDLRHQRIMAKATPAQLARVALAMQVAGIEGISPRRMVLFSFILQELREQGWTAEGEDLSEISETCES